MTEMMSMEIGGETTESKVDLKMGLYDNTKSDNKDRAQFGNMDFMMTNNGEQILFESMDCKGEFKLMPAIPSVAKKYTLCAFH